jgi:hypothetical protein
MTAETKENYKKKTSVRTVSKLRIEPFLLNTRQKHYHLGQSADKRKKKKRKKNQLQYACHFTNFSTIGEIFTINIFSLGEHFIYKTKI